MFGMIAFIVVGVYSEGGNWFFVFIQYPAIIHEHALRKIRNGIPLYLYMNKYPCFVAAYCKYSYEFIYIPGGIII